MTDPERLRSLPPGRFADAVAAALEAAHAGAVDASPPSPDGGVEAVVAADGERRLVRAVRSGTIGREAVADFATLADAPDVDTAAFLTAGEFTPEAREAAAEAGIELVDAEALAAMVEAADVALPTTGEGPPLPDLAEELTAEWPDELRDRVGDVVAFVADAGTFERRVTRGDELTDIDFLRDGEVVLRIRFSETGLLVSAREGTTLEPVVRLTAYRDAQPTATELEERISAALDAATD